MSRRQTSPTFEFRIWLRPREMCDNEVQVWYYELDPIEPNTRSISDWAYEHITSSICDLHEFFDVDPEKSWQILGKADITNGWEWIPIGDEYDEELNILEVHKLEVPEEWFEENNLVSFGENDKSDI